MENQNGIPEDEFKKMCPKLYKAIQDNQQEYELYGIKFMSHTSLTYHEYKRRAEDPRRLIYFSSSILVEENLKLITLN